MRSAVAAGCIACGGELNAHVLDLGTFSIEKCTRCGMHALSPAPEHVELEGFNDGSEYEAALGFRGAILAQHDRSLRAVERFVEPGRLLDVGSGPGQLLEVARARGWHAEGVDPSPWATAKARELGFIAHEGMLEELPLEPGSFDAIALLQVLEHMTDPRPLLAACHALLRPGGALLVATPNPRSWLARVKKEAFNYWIPPVHCVWYTPRALSLVLRDNRFLPVRESTWSAQTDGLHDGMELLSTVRATAKLPYRARRALAGRVARIMDATQNGTIVEQVAVKR